ncbi:MAG: hypothetical protein U0939_11150 [Pirellulales bacterium]
MHDSTDFFYREFDRRCQRLFPDIARLADAPPSTALLDRLFGSSPAAWLVPEQGEQSQLEVRQRQRPGCAQYLVVTRRQADSKRTASEAWREWLWPASHLPPTDLVYDVTEELLHGKAKPILCDLTRYPRRVFALLPTQLELVSLRAFQRVAPGGVIRLKASGADASERCIAGQLPFAVELVDPAGKSIENRYLVAATDGVLRAEQPVPRDAASGVWTLRVRSQLNGLETSLPVEVSGAAAETQDRAVLTCDGADSRWAPQPILS